MVDEARMSVRAPAPDATYAHHAECRHRLTRVLARCLGVSATYNLMNLVANTLQWPGDCFDGWERLAGATGGLCVNHAQLCGLEWRGPSAAEEALTRMFASPGGPFPTERLETLAEQVTGGRGWDGPRDYLLQCAERLWLADPEAFASRWEGYLWASGRFRPPAPKAPADEDPDGPLVKPAVAGARGWQEGAAA